MTWTAFTLAPPTGTPGALSAATRVKTLCVDPWTQGVGEGSGHYRHLSFPNACAALSLALNGETDAVFGVAVTAASYADFAGQLKALTGVFPIKQFTAAATRAAQLTTLEVDKFNLPAAPSAIAGGSMALQSLPSMAALQNAALVQSAKAAAESFQTSNPLDNLTAFQTAKTAADAAVNAALDAAKAALSGAGGWRFYAASDAAAAINSGPGHEYTLTAMLLFIGSPADLALLRAIAP